MGLVQPRDTATAINMAKDAYARDEISLERLEEMVEAILHDEDPRTAFLLDLPAYREYLVSRTLEA